MTRDGNEQPESDDVESQRRFEELSAQGAADINALRARRRGQPEAPTRVKLAPRRTAAGSSMPARTISEATASSTGLLVMRVAAVRRGAPGTRAEGTAEVPFFIEPEEDPPAWLRPWPRGSPW